MVIPLGPMDTPSGQRLVVVATTTLVCLCVGSLVSHYTTLELAHRWCATRPMLSSSASSYLTSCRQPSQGTPPKGNTRSLAPGLGAETLTGGVDVGRQGTKPVGATRLAAARTQEQHQTSARDESPHD